MIPSSRFLRWRSWGAGGRRALLLHGSTSSSATWWRVGPALAEAGWRVKAPTSRPRRQPARRPAADAGRRRRAGWPRAGRPPDRPGGRALVRGRGGPQPAGAGAGDPLDGARRAARSKQVDWAAEAESVLVGVAAARRDPAGARADPGAQPRWSDRDCRQAVHDLASSGADEIAGGAAAQGGLARPGAPRRTGPTLVIAAPGRGVGVGAGAVTPRCCAGRTGRRRARSPTPSSSWTAATACTATSPDAWLRAILDFTG